MYKSTEQFKEKTSLSGQRIGKIIAGILLIILGCIIAFFMMKYNLLRPGPGIEIMALPAVLPIMIGFVLILI